MQYIPGHGIIMNPTVHQTHTYKDLSLFFFLYWTYGHFYRSR